MDAIDGRIGDLRGIVVDYALSVQNSPVSCWPRIGLDGKGENYIGNGRMITENIRLISVEYQDTFVVVRGAVPPYRADPGGAGWICARDLTRA